VKMKILFLTFILAIVAVLAFATGKNEEKALTGGPVTIRMWTYLNPEAKGSREVALNHIITNFKKDFPNINVVVEPQQWDLMTPKFLAAAKTGTAPDVIWVIPTELGAAVDQGTLEPFENLFLKNWSANDIADVKDGYWDLGAKGNKHYQVGLTRNLYLIYYREDLLAAKGIKFPPVPTWDEFIHAAKLLTEKDAKTGLMRYGFGIPMSDTKPDPGIFVSSLIYEQGDMFSKDGKPMWSTDAGVRAMKLQTDMVRVHGITPQSVVNDNIENVINEFVAGKYAMIFAISSRIRQIQTTATFNPGTIKMMLIPSYDGKNNSPGVVGGWCIGVWSGGKNKQAAGKFVEYMFNPQSDSIWLKEGGQIPVRKSTIQANADFLSDPLNSFFPIVAKGFVSAAYFQPTAFPISGFKETQNKAAQMIIVNETPIKKALEDAEREFIKINTTK
jgi:multiple sugar transport system substrate-binding protein